LAEYAYRIMYRWKPESEPRPLKSRLYAKEGTAKGIMTREKRYYSQSEVWVERAPLNWEPIDG
jgi:hypothetical protein